MAKEVVYNQCRLERGCAGGMAERISYIPAKYAVVGRLLKIKDGDKWEDGWVVRNVYGDPIEERLLPDSYIAIKGHRRNTGDSMPKERK